MEHFVRKYDWKLPQSTNSQMEKVQMFPLKYFQSISQNICWNISQNICWNGTCPVEMWRKVPSNQLLCCRISLTEQQIKMEPHFWWRLKENNVSRIFFNIPQWLARRWGWSGSSGGRWWWPSLWGRWPWRGRPAPPTGPRISASGAHTSGWGGRTRGCWRCSGGDPWV